MFYFILLFFLMYNNKKKRSYFQFYTPVTPSHEQTVADKI